MFGSRLRKNATEMVLEMVWVVFVERRNTRCRSDRGSVATKDMRKWAPSVKPLLCTSDCSQRGAREQRRRRVRCGLLSLLFGSLFFLLIAAHEHTSYPTYVTYVYRTRRLFFVGISSTDRP